MKLRSYEEKKKENVDVLKKFKKLTGDYNKWIQEENKAKSEKEFLVQSVGKMNPKNHLLSTIDDTMNDTVM